MKHIDDNIVEKCQKMPKNRKKNSSWTNIQRKQRISNRFESNTQRSDSTSLYTLA